MAVPVAWPSPRNLAACADRRTKVRAAAGDHETAGEAALPLAGAVKPIAQIAYLNKSSQVVAKHQITFFPGSASFQTRFQLGNTMLLEHFFCWGQVLLASMI
jgi:hypothetical protein